MKRKYDPELIKDDLKKLIQQTLKEALEAKLRDFLGYSKGGCQEKCVSTHHRTSPQKARGGNV